MIIEICIGFVSIAFAILVVFLVVTLCKIMRTLKRSQRIIRDLEALSEEGLKLVKNANELSLDLKYKSEALNLFFHPLAKMEKGKNGKKNITIYEKVGDIINFAADGYLLFNKLKKKN